MARGLPNQNVWKTRCPWDHRYDEANTSFSRLRTHERYRRSLRREKAARGKPGEA